MPDLFSVAGKVAVVTGGSRGIGLMIARGLVDAGARVYISSRKAAVCEEVATELSKSGECRAVPADLRGRLRRSGILLPFAVLFIVLSVASGPFFTKGNLLNIVDQQVSTLLPAAAATLVLVAGGIDLSVGAVYGLAWLVGSTVIGALYGVALGGLFFGESMFSRVPDASKLALVLLARHLQHWGFSLIDTQFITPHLQSMGARELPRRDFLQALADLRTQHPPADWKISSSLHEMF